MRTFAAVSVGGLLSILLIKLLAVLMAPLMKWLMLAVGLAFMALKFVLIAAAVYFVYSLIFKRRKEREANSA